MQNKNSIMATFFMGTIGVMLILSGMIFLIYCFSYEIKNKKKMYKESKIVAVLCVVVGIIMTILSVLYFNNKLI